MWTDEQLDKATYVGHVDNDTKQPMLSGTIEVQGSPYQGPYLCVPMPPFGSLKSGSAGYTGQLVKVPARFYTAVPQPLSFPSPDRDNTPVHQYPLGDA